MQKRTVARTGLLLFLTAGPLLVFLFLYFFGKNEFELDRYQVPSPSFPTAYQTKALLLLPSQHLITGTERNAFRNEANRVVKFVSGSPGSISILRYGLGADTLADPVFDPIAAGYLELPLSLANLVTKDTLLSVINAKGERSEKVIPAPPRAFLFDETHNLRGIYGLTNSLSVDTLMLEYKILNQP